MLSKRDVHASGDDPPIVRSVTTESNPTGYRAGCAGREYVSSMASATPIHNRQGRPEINADLQDIAYQIHEEFDERLDPRVIEESLVTVAASFADATVRSFVPLLVRRYVSEDLHARLGHT
jgi:hypothetical protein